MRIRAAAALAIAALVVVGCMPQLPRDTDPEADGKALRTPLAFDESPVAPVRGSEIADTTDLRGLLDQLDFPVDWPLPAGMTGADVAYLRYAQLPDDATTGVSVEYSLALRHPAADLEGAAREAFDALSAALPEPSSETRSERSGSSSDVAHAEVEQGGIRAVAWRPVDDPAATIVVLLEYDVTVGDGIAGMQFAGADLGLLPLLSGCEGGLTRVAFAPDPLPAELMDWDEDRTGYTVDHRTYCDDSQLVAVERWGLAGQERPHLVASRHRTEADGTYTHVAVEPRDSNGIYVWLQSCSDETLC